MARASGVRPLLSSCARRPPPDSRKGLRPSWHSRPRGARPGFSSRSAAVPLPGVVDAYPQPARPRVDSRSRTSAVARVLGSELPPEQVVTPLEALGFTVDLLPDGYAVTAPYWRSDVRIADDVVGRDRPYRGLRIACPARRSRARSPIRIHSRCATPGRACVTPSPRAGAGRDDQLLAREHRRHHQRASARYHHRPPPSRRSQSDGVRSGTSSGRRLRPGLLESFATNRRRQRRANSHSSRIGRVFHPRPDDLPHERTFALALLGGVGPKAAVHEGERGPQPLLTSSKPRRFAQSVAGAPGAAPRFHLRGPRRIHALYTGRAARVLVGGAAIGCIGQIAPAVAAARFEIEEPILPDSSSIVDALTQVSRRARGRWNSLRPAASPRW